MKDKPVYDPADYKDADNLAQSASIMSAAATILRIAHGELCATNALVDKAVFSDKEMRSFQPAFTKVMNLLSKSYVAFVNRSTELREASRNSGAN